MYSKNKGLTDRDYILTPPPGYDGSRFRRRSDGRDDAFPMYSDKPKRIQPPEPPVEECRQEPAEAFTDECEEEVSCPCEESGTDECPCECCTPEKSQKKDSSILSFLQGIGSEELLLIALIVLLSKDSKAGIETVLILALLLCIT